MSKEKFKVGDLVKVVSDGCNASTFTRLMNGTERNGVYWSKNWPSEVFKVEGLVGIYEGEKCYSLSQNGVLLGAVYEYALTLVESSKKPSVKRIERQVRFAILSSDSELPTDVYVAPVNEKFGIIQGFDKYAGCLVSFKDNEVGDRFSYSDPNKCFKLTLTDSRVKLVEEIEIVHTV